MRAFKDAPSTCTGESSAEKMSCYLCKNLGNATTMISLQKILKEDSMIEVFQGHIEDDDMKEDFNELGVKQKFWWTF